MDAKGKMFKESLNKIQLPFLISGLPLHNSEKFTTKQRFLFYIHFFCIVSGVSGAFHFFCEGLARGEDMTKLTYMAPCICYSFLSIVKSLTLILNRSKITELINSLINLEEKTKKHHSNRVYEKERNSFHKVIFYFSVVYFILLIAFCLAPLIMMAVKYYGGNFELIYPFSISYPFDKYRLEVFPAVYLYEVESLIVVLIFTSSADYFFYVCCIYISIQFKLLQSQFEAIIPANKINKITFADIEVKFVELLEWHQKLISLTNTLEDIYAKSTLYNFVSSSVLICLTLFNVTAIQDIAFALTFLSFLSMCLGQIYFLCYFGDKVTQASIEVSSAVYNSVWYMYDSSVGKHLLLVIIRSQKPCKLTALGFADVNQRAFMKILSNAWSFFALLKTIYH